MAVHVWNEVVVYDDDGWGYRIGEGDVGEVVVYYFEKQPMGKVEKEHFRLYNGSSGRLLVESILNKFDEMDSRGE